MDFTNRIKTACCVSDGSQGFSFLDIKGCRNGVTVYKRDKIDIFTGCTVEYAYSDGGVDLNRTSDECPPIVTLAPIDCLVPNVKECNSDAILAELQAINAKTVDYTLLLTAIKTAVESIDAKSSDLANILAAVDGLEALTTTGNATLTDIKAALLVIQTEAQAINANTDTLETLISTYTSVFQTESDQTQVILSDTLAVNTAIKAVLEATCADAFKQKVEVCNFPVAPIVTPGAFDLTIDIANVGSNITSYGVPSTVKSITLSTQEDVELQTNYGVKKLYADKSYTWNQGTNVDMDVSSFKFITDAKLVEVIFDI